MWSVLSVLLIIFFFIIAPLAVILGYILFFLFGTWGAVIGVCVGLGIHLLGLRNFWALQKLALMYLLYLLLIGIWPAIFIGLFFWMKHK
jgi:hypothetical protein